MARAAVRSAFLVAALYLIACQTSPGRVGELPPSVPDHQQEHAYRAVFDRYSARKEIYAHLDTRIFAGMTFQSWAFRKARVEREAAFKFLPKPDVERLLLKEKQDFDAANEFFLGVHVNDRTYDDFDRQKSVWRIALLTPSYEVTPLLVERVGRSNLDLRAFYPYLDDFWVGYWVRFPGEVDGNPVIPPGTERIQVRIASVLGKAEFSFPAE